MVPATLITLGEPEYRKQNKKTSFESEKKLFFTILTELCR